MAANTRKGLASARGGARGDGGRQLLLLAWAVLIGLIGGAVLWTNVAREDEDPSRPRVSVALPAPETAASPSEAPSSSAAAPVQPPPSTEAPPADPPARPAAPTETARAPEPEPPPAPAPQAAEPDPPASPPADLPAPAPPPPPAPAAPSAPQQAAVFAPRAPLPREPMAPAWIRYGRSFDANDRRPRVAVVVSELGLSSAATNAAIQNLPAAVTLAFSPYADSLDHWIGLARAAGHEVLLNLPMEPINFPVNDPGPRALLTSLSAQQNLERLDWVLGRVNGYVGVSNHMGSRFTTMPEALKPVLTAINERGLMFVDSRASTRSVAAKVASDIGLPRAINDRQIDQEASRPAIDGRLAEIERIARESGAAVAMAQPYPVTIERLQAWIGTLETKGLVLAPITAVANRQPDR